MNVKKPHERHSSFVAPQIAKPDVEQESNDVKQRNFSHRAVILMEESGKSMKLYAAFGRLIASVLLLGSMISVLGCIRFAGGAGYYTEKQGERTERAAGFDSAELFQKASAPGSAAT